MPQEMQFLIRSALDKSVVHPGELPAIDLYMDQVITLIENGYAANKRTPQEKLLTKTMINNYSKEGLIRSVRGKKYSREQIVQMLVVYSLKGTLSIGEIKRVLGGLYAQEGFDGQRLFDCYEKALGVREAQLPTLALLLDEVVTQTAESAEAQDAQFSALLTIAALSEALRSAAQSLVDEYFTLNPPAETKHPRKKQPSE